MKMFSAVNYLENKTSSVMYDRVLTTPLEIKKSCFEKLRKIYKKFGLETIPKTLSNIYFCGFTFKGSSSRLLHRTTAAKNFEVKKKTSVTRYFIVKRTHYKSFQLRFTKFLRVVIFQSTSKWLLLAFINCSFPLIVGAKNFLKTISSYLIDDPYWGFR